MLGDSVRRLQADELDAEWDLLAIGSETAHDSELSSLIHRLTAALPPVGTGAKERVRGALFAEIAKAGGPNRLSRQPPAIEQVSARLPVAPPVPAPRWWSSPVAVLEALVACVLIAVLALGISEYRSNNTPQRSRQFPSILNGQSGQLTLRVYPETDLQPIAVMIFDVTIDPASTWFGPDEWPDGNPSSITVLVISGELYTDNMFSTDPITPGQTATAWSFLRNNNRTTPLVVRAAVVTPATQAFPESTRNTAITPITLVPVERPEGSTVRDVTLKSSTYTGSPGENLDQEITLDDDFVALESGAIRVESRGDQPIAIGRIGDSSTFSTPTMMLASGESAVLSAGDTATFAGTDRAPRFTFADSSPVSLLMVSTHTSPFQAAYVSTVAPSRSWTLPEGNDHATLILRELTIQPGANWNYDLAGLTLYRAITGSVTLEADGDQVPLSAGQTTSLLSTKGIGIANPGTTAAMLIQAIVVPGEDAAAAWGHPSAMIGSISLKRIAIATVDLPSGTYDGRLSWLDEAGTTQTRATRGVELFANRGFPLSIAPLSGDLSIRTVVDDGSNFDLSAGGYIELTPGLAQTLLPGGATLAQPNSVFTVSAQEGVDVLAYAITLTPILDPLGFPALAPASPVATP
jgi:hypothetical protein